MERYGDTGRHSHWYCHGTGAKLTDRRPQHNPKNTNGVVTPHAALLALHFALGATRTDIARLARDFHGLYSCWGFRDSVNLMTKRVSDPYLSLGQGMIIASLG